MKKETPREKKQDKKNRKVAINGEAAERKNASRTSSTSRGEEFIKAQSDKEDTTNDTAENADYDKINGVKK